MQSAFLFACAGATQYILYVVDVWPAASLDATIEIDGACIIKQAGREVCALFGYPVTNLRGANLLKLLNFGTGTQ